MKTLVDALNSFDFAAFPRKDGKGSSITAEDKDGTRYFLTRVATNEVDDQGRAKYMWARGQAMRSMNENKE